MEIPEKSPPLPFMVLRPGLRPGPSWSGEVARVGLEEQGVGGKGKERKERKRRRGRCGLPYIRRIYGTPYIRRIYTPYMGSAEVVGCHRMRNSREKFRDDWESRAKAGEGLNRGGGLRGAGALSGHNIT